MSPNPDLIPFLNRLRSVAAPRLESFDERSLGRLGEAIADNGMTAHEPQLDALARFARRHGMAPAAARVMIDRSSATVARERAFSVVAAAVVRLSAADGEARAAC